MTETCIISIDKTKLDDSISSNKTEIVFEIDVCDLVRLYGSRREEGFASNFRKIYCTQ